MKNNYARSFLKYDHSFLKELEELNRSRNDIQPPVEFEAAKTALSSHTLFQMLRMFLNLELPMDIQLSGLQQP